jgi:crotonobetainyl-CoA:carnitine CoA-transferase CaiB-like acyl-CoA transferase
LLSTSRVRKAARSSEGSWKDPMLSCTNFRPGVPEKLGVGYDQVKAINPRLCYLYGASYGSKGPESKRAAFHSTPHALSGGGILQAGEGNPPGDDSYPDPCAGLAAGTALALSLLGRDVTGTGQYLETTMLTSTAWVHSNRLVRYEGCTDLPTLDRHQHGLAALNGFTDARAAGSCSTS